VSDVAANTREGAKVSWASPLMATTRPASHTTTSAKSLNDVRTLSTALVARTDAALRSATTATHVSASALVSGALL